MTSPLADKVRHDLFSQSNNSSGGCKRLCLDQSTASTYLHTRKIAVQDAPQDNGARRRLHQASKQQPASNNNGHNYHHHVNGNGSGPRLPTTESHPDQQLKEWRAQWRRILASSNFYFDFEDDTLKERFNRQLGQSGALIAKFFDTSVTHVVTSRSNNLHTQYGPRDVITQARANKIRVWTIEKLQRFLNNVFDGNSKTHEQTHDPARARLSNLLKEEKLFGPSDRDPRARRDDYHYFRGPYIYVWDLTRKYRPIMVKEYQKVSDPEYGDWPQFRFSMRCPFILEHNPTRPSPTPTGERTLQVISDTSKISQRSNITGKQARLVDVLTTQKAAAAAAAVAEDKENSGQQPGPPPRMSSFRTVADDGERLHEIVATGINMSNNTSAVRSVATGDSNGLGCTDSQVQSKELNSLKRKLFKRQRLAGPTPVPQIRVKRDAVAQKEMKPGYCENCRDKFDDFENHVRSKKHMKFAMNHDNFVELDALLELVSGDDCLDI